MAKSRARDLAKEAAWRRRLAGHAKSGQSVRAWCRRHRVKEAAFHWRRRDRLKILYWDRDGYALWYKRLEQGTFRMPVAKDGATHVELKASELAMFLEGIDLRSIRRRKRFRQPA